MFIKNLWNKILGLFGIKTQTTDTETSENEFYNQAYEDIKKINFNSIFANKLSNYVSNESTLSIDITSKRAEMLEEVMKKIDKDKKKITNRMLGTGGVVLVPYVADNKLYYNIVPQFRLNINETKGDRITNATLLADIKKVKEGFQTKSYYRWTNESVEGNKITITQKYTDEYGNPIPKPECYAGITKDQIIIPNVDRCLFGYYKSPVDNRKTTNNYGVPITYGCGTTINEIYECLVQIRREFQLKEAFVGADSTMFDGKDALPTNGLYRKVDSGDDSFWEVFDPQIRDSSYYARLQELYERLEKQVGTSKGILSTPETINATATEIKKAMYDTYTIVEDTREQFEKGTEDFIYACDVYANYYNIVAMGDYKIVYDWSTDLLESTQETWSQLLAGLNEGVVEKVEIRQFLYPSESLEESQKKVDEIAKSKPSLKDLMGAEEE